MRRETNSLTLACLLALLALVGCGAREVAPGAYPYPARSQASTAPLPHPPPQAAVEPTAVGLGVTTVVLYAGNVYGVVVDEQMRVVHVEPGGGADQGGLRVGDQLKSIAGVAILPGDRATLQQARETAVSLQPPPPAAGVPVPFVVERDGATLTLAIAPAQLALRETPGEPVPTATPVLPPFDYF